MNLLQKAVSLAVASFFLCASPAALAKTILYVPQDDRPVDYEYTVSTAEAAGYQVLTPPAQYLSGMNFHGSPDKLMAWVNANAVNKENRNEKKPYSIISAKYVLLPSISFINLLSSMVPPGSILAFYCNSNLT